MATDWIMTASGLKFWPLEPRVEDVRIDDIAHALAAMNRFCGHTREPYSVAQHCVLASHEMEKVAHANGWSDWALVALYGLLHDASEAYLCDVPRPLKRLPAFAAYREAEDQVMAAIYVAFGLNPAGEPDCLKTIDRMMLRTEQKFLMPPAAEGEDRNDVPLLPIAIRPWPAAFAKQAFLARFHDLQRARESQVA